MHLIRSVKNVDRLKRYAETKKYLVIEYFVIDFHESEICGSKKIMQI